MLGLNRTSQLEGQSSPAQEHPTSLTQQQFPTELEGLGTSKQPSETGVHREVAAVTPLSFLPLLFVFCLQPSPQFWMDAPGCLCSLAVGLCPSCWEHVWLGGPWSDLQCSATLPLPEISSYQ